MQNPKHFNFCMLLLLVFMISFFMKPLKCENEKALKFDVGIIGDLDTTVGKMRQTCMLMALEDLEATYNHTIRIVPHLRNSNSDVVDAASAAIDLLKNMQVHAILGPQRSTQADFVIDIGNKVKVPIISPATSASLSPKESPYFIRAAMSSSFQTEAIAAMVKAFGWKEVGIIYENDDYGTGFVPSFTDAMRQINALVKSQTVISPSWTDGKILLKLFELRNMPTRVFVVHILPRLASRFFIKAKEIGMMSKGYAWIITDVLTSLLGSMDGSAFESMQGALGLRPYIPRTNELDNFTRRWRKRFYQENPDMDRFELSAFGLWAYDSIRALAMAIETVGMTPHKFMRPVNSVNLTDLDAIGNSDVGPLLIHSLRNITFKGLSGNFRIVDGQLQSSAFQIVNVNSDKGEKVIGYWSKSYGISKELKPSGRRVNRTSKNDLDLDLGAIIWPGDSTIVPKCGELPVTSHKKLKVAVPVNIGFVEFVDVGKDPQPGPISPTGFCIDVFKEVMSSLPYAVLYEFFACNTSSFDDLVPLVKLEKYDAVVGDVTILADRSSSVDFTFPFTESGVAILAPVKTDERKNPWIFMKPLTMDLWLTIGAFFIFTGFVVWVLEHRVNKEFRGPPRKQVGIIFWFSFSTLVFAHKEKVMSNLSRFVIIVWVFVVLVLTSSYQASLTSMLTVQQLQLTVTGIADLIKHGDYVGYQKASFVYELLKRKNFDSSKFRAYGTPEEYDEALSKGSKNGGVAAIIDEIPYIRLFLAKYPNKYTIVGPIYRTAGFGFVFPKGSPLVHDVSKAVLSMTEGDKMVNISRKWFSEEASYTEEQRNDVSSGSLTLDSFRGLFLVAGISSSLALFLFLFIFVYENRDILASNDPILQKLSKMAKIFDEEKENSSRGLERPTEAIDGNIAGAENVLDTGMTMSTYPQNPEIGISNHAQGVFSQDEGFSTTEPGSPIDDVALTTERTEER